MQRSDPTQATQWWDTKWRVCVCVYVCVNVLITDLIKDAAIDINKTHFLSLHTKKKPKQLKNDPSALVIIHSHTSKVTI